MKAQEKARIKEIIDFLEGQRKSLYNLKSIKACDHPRVGCSL